MCDGAAETERQAYGEEADESGKEISFSGILWRTTDVCWVCVMEPPAGTRLACLKADTEEDTQHSGAEKAMPTRGQRT